MQIRLANLDDIENLRRVMRESVLGLSGGFYDEGQIASAAQYIAIPDPDIIRDGTYFVVEKDQEIIGCGGWSRLRKLFTGTSDQEGLGLDPLDPATEPARIRAMFVLPSVARLGVGKLIYETCERAAFEQGFRELELMATLPGVPFYEKVGFEAIEPQDMILPDGVVVPGLRMRKSIANLG